jgi:UDP-N-acetylglucosamine acyltransferase
MDRSQISRHAKIDPSVIIGSYTVIEDGVEIGANTIIGTHVLIRTGSSIGNHNKIYDGVQIGTDPQDHHFHGEPSSCSIGDGNIIREYSTISRATGAHKATCIGDNNYIMTYVHIAHNITIGDNNIIASGSQLGGYVELGDHVNLGGLVGIHQFSKIGRHAMVGAMSYVNKDIPPFLLVRGNPARIFGVNVRGLQRYGFTPASIEHIKDIYRVLLKSSGSLEQHIEQIKKHAGQDRYTRDIVDFIDASKRGIIMKNAVMTDNRETS